MSRDRKGVIMALRAWLAWNRVGGASRPRPPTPPYVLKRIRRFLQMVKRREAPRPVSIEISETDKASSNAAGWFRLATAPWPASFPGNDSCLRPIQSSNLAVCSLHLKIQPFAKVG